MNINSRRDLKNYITDTMGEDGHDSCTQAVINELFTRDDMPDYGAGSEAWSGFLDPLDFWQIHELTGSSNVGPVCHPNNLNK